MGKNKHIPVIFPRRGWGGHRYKTLDRKKFFLILPLFFAITASSGCFSSCSSTRSDVAPFPYLRNDSESYTRPKKNNFFRDFFGEFEGLVKLGSVFGWQANFWRKAEERSNNRQHNGN